MPGGYRGKHAAAPNRTILFLLAGAAAALLLAAAIFYLRPDPSQGPASGVPVGNPVPGTDSSSADMSSSGAVSSEVSSAGEVSQPPEPDQPDPPPPYDFSQPAPASEPVDSDYFADAAFVGDSRTDGFMIYSGIGTGRNLTSNGLSIFKLAEKKALTIGGEKYTLLEALAMEHYGKVYLSLGVNELGIHNDAGFYSSYCDAIDAIRAVQPEAVIYIQGLIPLNEQQIQQTNGNKYNLTNDHLRVYNDLMRQAAQEKQVVYLDLYTEFADENGSLPEGISRDGVHLKKDACKQWLDYLKRHTVDFDVLYPDGPPAVPGEEEPAQPAEPAQPDTSTADGSVQG